MSEERSLDTATEQIRDARTHEYFKEVLSSYHNGNYRSAVVMLWTVVVCDLVFKLREMAQLYSDATAETILKEIEALQTSNPKSSEWEIKLLEKVAAKTSLIEAAEKHNLEQIQQQRHLSAHPILSSGDDLYHPNRALVAGLIRVALDSVFCKPAHMTRKIFGDFAEDIEAIGPKFTDDQLRTYIARKYLDGLPDKALAKVFQNWWSITFVKSDPRCDKNREVNCRAMLAIFRERRDVLKPDIRSNSRTYTVATSGPPVDIACAFLSKEPDVYPLLDIPARQAIAAHANSNHSIFASAWYLSADPKTHLSSVFSKQVSDLVYTSPMRFSRWLDECDVMGLRNDALDLGIRWYGGSGNYNQADERCAACILPYLNEFSATQLSELVNAIESNIQTSNRSKASIHHPGIKAACDSMAGLNIDWTRFPRFMASLQ